MEARLVVVVSPTFEGVARLAELISVSREFQVSVSPVITANDENQQLMQAGCHGLPLSVDFDGPFR